MLALGIIGLGEIGQYHTELTGVRKPQTPEKQGLLGAGRQFARNLLRGKPSASAHPPTPGIAGSRLVAVSDVDESRRAWATQTFEIPFAYADYKQLLARADVDAVLICTPPALHSEITSAAAKHGKHVFCEKPMARTSAQCMEMIEATDKAGVVLQIGYMLRFANERSRIADAIRNQEIGRPVFYREAMNLRAGGPQQWIHDKDLGGGIVWEMSHCTDYYRSIFGEPDHVYAIGGHYKPNNVTALDTYAVSFTFPTGDKVLFSDSYALKNFGYEHVACRAHRLEIDVVGPKGYLQFPDADLGQRLTICRYGDPADQIDKMSWTSEWGADIGSYRRELEHFIECVRLKKKPAVSGYDGLRTVQLAEAIMKSIETGNVCATGSTQRV